MSAYLTGARAAGLTWPLSEDLNDGQLEALLFPPTCGIPADQRPLPDWAWVHRELRRPDVTLALLWEEYRTGSAASGCGRWCPFWSRRWSGMAIFSSRRRCASACWR